VTVRTRGSTGESLGRLTRWAPRDLGTELWWASLGHELDELGEELARTDIAGLVAQITTDAPHFAAAARRLPLIDEQVRREVSTLGRVVADRSGADAAREVSGAVEVLLRRVRTLYRLSNDLMLDAYERDIGGD